MIVSRKGHYLPETVHDHEEDRTGEGGNPTEFGDMA
jgi:hypothetical protein